jgi:magnesium transporter
MPCIAKGIHSPRVRLFGKLLSLMGGQVHITSLVGGASFERGVDPSELDEQLADVRNLVWVDVIDPGADERAFLLEHFAFHPLAIDDSVRGHERPKLDEHASYFFVVGYGALPRARTQEPLALAEVGLFVGRNYLVTVHAKPLPAIGEALARFERSGPLLQEGVGYLLYLVLDGLMNSYAPVVDGLGHALDDIEDRIALGPAEERIERLLELRRDVFQLRRILYPMREAFVPLLRAERALSTPAVRVYLQDVRDHVLRLLDLLDVHREMVAGSIDASLTIVSNRLNMTMKRLTVVSAVLGFAGCIFGAWGMNVRDVPGSRHAYGFELVLTATACVVVAMLALGRRKGWL